MITRLNLTGEKCIDQEHGEAYSLYHGDSIRVAKGIPDNSVGLILSSWPFGNQYGYSDEVSDLGMTNDNDQFFEQMEFLIPEMLRITIPGRLCVVHCKDRIVYGSKSEHGVLHIDRFSDHVADAMEAHGWLCFGRVTISTDVVAENHSTHRLTQKEMRKDASKMGVGMPEYLMVFRKKPSGNMSPDSHSDEPVLVGDNDYYSVSQWQLDANSLWRSNGNRMYYPWEENGVYNYHKHIEHLESHIAPLRGSGTRMLEPIPVNDNTWILADNVDYRRMNILSANGKAKKNQTKHICPLQLDVIERCISRWSNKGDVIYDPFAGIGSVPVVAIEMGRYGLGSELNGPYFKQAVNNCADKEARLKVPTLFDWAGLDV